MKVIVSCVVAAFLVLLSGGASACERGEIKNTLQGSGDFYTVSILTKPDKVSVGKPFSMTLSVCLKDGNQFAGKVKINAMMPMHKHGMNYKPTVKKVSTGKFEIKGFVFHMPGQWQYMVELVDGASSEKILIDYKL